MVYSFKELRKQANARREAKTQEYDEEGKALIKINVNDDTNFLSTFSLGSEPVINNDVADFLNYNTLALKPREQIHLVIESDVIDENEQTQYKTGIKRYYESYYEHNRLELNRNAITALIMLMVSIVVFTIMVIVSQYNIGAVWLEIIDVIGWVFAWEAVDVFFLQRHLLRVEKYRCLALIGATIEFIPKTKNLKNNK